MILFYIYTKNISYLQSTFFSGLAPVGVSRDLWLVVQAFGAQQDGLLNWSKLPLNVGFSVDCVQPVAAHLQTAL